MGGCRCSFRNCTSATKSGHEYHFFHFPVKQKERCLEWIKQAQKPHFIELPDDQLKNKVICELHFAPHEFTNIEKRRLIRSAIPRPQTNDQEEKTEVKIVPASADGTIFTLDQEFLNNSNSFIPTYNIDNDSLVLIKEKPTSLNDIVKVEPIKDSQFLLSKGDDGSYVIIESTEIEKQLTTKPVNTKTKATKSESIPINTRCQIFSQNEPVELMYSSKDKVVTPPVELVNEAVIEMESDPLYIDEPMNVTVPIEEDLDNTVEEVSIKQNEEVHTRKINKKSKFRKKSIRQIIKEHSAAISRLERMNSFNRTLNKLKRAPPSFITLLNILTKDAHSKYNDKERDLLTFLSSHPEVYKTLKEKYGWVLPEIVEGKDLNE